MDAPSAQLQHGLRDAITSSLASQRPILHHLNADTSWLFQIPRPAAAVKHGSRLYYNVLIDPWFVGGQSDVARWFSQQWHAAESAVKSIAEVEELAREIEILAGGLRLGKGRVTSVNAGANVDTFIDAIAISHEFTDHCHKDTLLEVGKDVPVFATEKAASLIRSWSHFRAVHPIEPFTAASPDWRNTSLPPLPEWLSISRLQASSDALYYHSALLICFNTTPSTSPSFSSSSISSDSAEALIYTPHGVPPSALAPIAVADPPIQTLAFLHGLHSVSIGSAQQLNLGAENGVQAQRLLRSKYWVGTHDEVKRGGGVIGWFLRRRVWTLEEAIEGVRMKEKMRDAQDANGDVDMIDGHEELDNGKEGEWEDVKFEEISNGESRILI